MFDSDASNLVAECLEVVFEGVDRRCVVLQSLEGAALADAEEFLEAAELLRHGVGQVEREIENLRAIITDLRPAALDQLGTGPALEALEPFHPDRLAVSWMDVVLPLSLVALWLGCFIWQLRGRAILPGARTRKIAGARSARASDPKRARPPS